MAEDDQAEPRRHGRFWRRVIAGLLVFVALLVLFHRPILLAIGRKIVLNYAAKENLKADFRVEGNPFGSVTIRNLHAFAVGPSKYESIDIDYLYLDYSLLGFARHGLPRLFDAVEARSANIVLNPSKAPLRPRLPKPQLKLPRFFPERLRATDTTVIVRNQPYDFVLGHADLELNPRTPGELRIETLQVPSGNTWSRISGQTSYTNKNLILRDFVLSDQEQLHFLQIDASQIDANYLGVDLKCTVGGGQISASAALTETKSSLDTKLHVTAEKVAAEALNKFLVIPENYLSGEIERLALNGTGTIDAPRTWDGTLSLQMNDVHRQGINFDRGVLEISAEQGRGILRSADIVQDVNKFHFRGGIELPATIEDFGRTPTNLEISGTAPDLKRLTAGTPVGLTGSAEFNGRINVVNATVEADLGVSAEAVGFQDGVIDRLNCRLRASKRVVRGDSKRPWFADLRTAMEFTLTGIRYRDYIVDSVNGSINGTDDILGLDLVTLRRNQNELSIRGRYQLPESFGNAASQPAQLDIALNAPEIGDFWVPNSPNKISGPLQMTAHVEQKEAQIDGQVSISGSNLKMRDLIVQHLSARASIVTNVLHLNEFSATLNDTDFAKATGTFDLQAPYHYNGKLSAQIANLSVLEPLLRAFGNEKQLAGSLKLDWEGSGELGTALSKAVALANASPSPGAQSVSHSATAQPVSPSPTAQSLSQQAGAQSASPSPSAPSLSQQAGAQSVSPSPTAQSVSQQAGAQSVSPSPSAQSVSQSPDVQSVVKLFGLPRGKNSGHLKLSLENGRYGDSKGLQANFNASYSPEGLHVPTISFTTDNMDFQAIARTKDDRLEIDKIQLDQGLAKFASGYISIPFVWSNLGTNAPVIPPSGKVSATVQVENLDLKRLDENLGINSGVSGVLNARLDASGTVADLNAQLVVQVRDLRNEYWPKMEPASFELTAQVAHNRLTALGKLQQPRIQPLEITATMPFDLRKIVQARGFPDDTPITAKARLPRSSVNFVRQFVPDLAQLDGDLGLDVDVNGTFGHPVLSGAGDMTVNVARFTNATLPTLRGFNVRFTFTDNALTLDRFGGDLAGGPFTMSGRVTFAKLTEPILDLQMRAQSVLIARNDTLTARADGDVRVTGPFAAATVSGNIALTNSRFLKNIDLIPIGLPGRPAPQPPTERPEFFSLPGPPFRDWKFDVAIKTKDPVLIRGNLATGEATTDLKLTGTGLKPGLQGMVHMEGVEATLPFSRLDVSRGSLTFDPKDSTNPTIDLQGTSVIRDYTVRVYVYGTLLAPQAIFTSEPPLPQEEIISLIATGTTRRELSTGNVLAGRAAMLLVQQLYRKIVKKGEPTDSNTVFNRLDLDLGTVDPRTGQQQATVRFKITDQLVLTGDVGVRGDFRGKLKYLIRFR